jgi:ubiquinone biosynthesis protein Coq4
MKNIGKGLSSIVKKVVKSKPVEASKVKPKVDIEAAKNAQKLKDIKTFNKLRELTSSYTDKISKAKDSTDTSKILDKFMKDYKNVK